MSVQFHRFIIGTQLIWLLTCRTKAAHSEAAGGDVPAFSRGGRSGKRESGTGLWKHGDGDKQPDCGPDPLCGPAVRRGLVLVLRDLRQQDRIPLAAGGRRSSSPGLTAHWTVSSESRPAEVSGLDRTCRGLRSGLDLLRSPEWTGPAEVSGVDRTCRGLRSGPDLPRSPDWTGPAEVSGLDRTCRVSGVDRTCRVSQMFPSELWAEQLLDVCDVGTFPS